MKLIINLDKHFTPLTTGYDIIDYAIIANGEVLLSVWKLAAQKFN